MTDETRYAKTKRTEQSKARHAANVQKLSTPVVERWEQAMDEARRPCVKAGIPSKWTDWATDPELREDYEGEPPTQREAEEMCAECPLRDVLFGGDGLCSEYAMATGESHGVWGGKAREDGKWLHGKTAHTAKAT